MLKDLWQKICGYNRKEKGESLRQASQSLGIPKSTIHYQEKRSAARAELSGTEVWNTAWGQWHLKRLIVSVIYTFGIKGGIGAGRIAEHFQHLQIGKVAAISESSIHRSMKEIESNILWYKELVEKGLQEESKDVLKDLKVTLGLDETWLDEMLLVCQDLTSGYLFLKSRVKNEMPNTGGSP